MYQPTLFWTLHIFSINILYHQYPFASPVLLVSAGPYDWTNLLPCWAKGYWVPINFIGLLKSTLVDGHVYIYIYNVSTSQGSNMFQISIKGWSLARTAGLGWCHLLELDIAAHGCSVPIQVKWRDMAIIRHDSASAASLASSAGDGRTAHTGSPPTNKMVGEFSPAGRGLDTPGSSSRACLDFTTCWWQPWCYEDMETMWIT